MLSTLWIYACNITTRAGTMMPAIPIVASFFARLEASDFAVLEVLVAEGSSRLINKEHQHVSLWEWRTKTKPSRRQIWLFSDGYRSLPE